jgi:competence protein ComEC
MVLILLSSVWIIGVFLGSIFNISPYCILTTLAPLVALIFSRQYIKQVILVSVCILILCGGIVRFTSSISDNRKNDIRSYNNVDVEMQGMISNNPEKGNSTFQLELTVSKIKQNDDWYPLSGKVIIFTSDSREYLYGDVLTITGKLGIPPPLNDFDYQSYLANQGIYSMINFPSIELIAHEKGNKFINFVFMVRNDIAKTLSKILPEPQASLAQGIILGIEDNIPQSLKDDFSKSGTSHVLAVSGQNLSIITGILISLGIWIFGRRYHIYVWVAFIILWFYTVLTGLNPPVVRSAIMASLFLIAEMLGRQKSAGTVLIFTAAIMIGITPLVLWDVSFQLSFLAMVGLVTVAPVFQDSTREFVNEKFGDEGIKVLISNIILDSLDVTLSAIILIWPLIAYYFGIFSLVAPFSSLLVVLVMTGIIAFGLFAVGIGTIALPIGQVIGWVVWLFLTYMILIVKYSAALPHSYLKVNSIALSFILIYYLVLAATIYLANQKQLLMKIIEHVRPCLSFLYKMLLHIKPRWLVTTLCIIAILVVIVSVTIPDKNLHIDFLNVGQGDAILIRQGNQQVLIDGGPNSQAINLNLGKYMPFWDRVIELVVLTHPDADHLTGLVDVIQKYRVAQVLYPDFSSDTSVYQEWMALLHDRRVKSIAGQANQYIDLGNGISLNVLNPSIPAAFETSSDDNGIVLRLDDGVVSFLFTGDISALGEFTLISKRADLASSVLKVAHHGSSGSTTEELLNAVKPQIAVISVGENNRYNHPSDETLKRLNDCVGEGNVYRTDEDGTVEFITDGKKLWIIVDN